MWLNAYQSNQVSPKWKAHSVCKTAKSILLNAKMGPLVSQEAVDGLDVIWVYSLPLGPMHCKQDYQRKTDDNHMAC